MQRILFFFGLITIFAFGCKSKEAQTNENGGYGAAITAEGAIPISELKAKMGDQKVLENIKLEAPIVASCQKSGCWMDVKNGDEVIKVTFKDYKFFVPKDCPGKTAIMEGKAYYETRSVDDLRHFATDGGMSEEEAEKKYTEPQDVLTFEAIGVIIK